MEWEGNDTWCPKLLFFIQGSMVLGANIMKIKIKLMISTCLITLSTAACANTEAVTIKDSIISLDTEKCSIKFNGKETNLGLNRNCFFIKKSNSEEIRIEYYKDIFSYVLLVVGTSVKNSPDFPLIQSREDCGSQLQAIRISNIGNISLSKVMSNTITCAGIGVDEKEFWILAH